MFVLLLMFFPVSQSQVPTHTTQLTLLNHTCRLHNQVTGTILSSP